jgi:hypothetical protein
VQTAGGEFGGAAVLERRRSELPEPCQRLLQVARSLAAITLPAQQPSRGFMRQRLVERAARCQRIVDAFGEQAARGSCRLS